MRGSRRSLLFFEDNLDLEHLRQSLEEYELDSLFSPGTETFKEECDKKKYDLLIISGIGRSDNNFLLIDSLSFTKNADTPVLLIIDNNSVPTVDELLQQQSNIITFPFSPQEFFYRAYHIFRRVDTEKNVDSSLKSYKNMIDILPVGLVQTDGHGKFIRANPKFLEIIDMPEQDLFKENFFQLCHPDDYFLERKQLDRLLRKETTCVEYEIRIINNEGKTFVCAIEAIILWSAPEIFESFTFIARLIS